MAESNSETFIEAASIWHLDKLYGDLAVAKKQEFSSAEGLTATEKIHLCGLLCGYSPKEIAVRRNRSIQATQVELCKTIYRYVEELTGNPRNSIDNWRTIIDWLTVAGYRQKNVSPISVASHTDWGNAPVASNFYGRTEEIMTLQQWIVTDRCSLVGLLGMGGIGKTALAVQLIEQIHQEFDRVVWRSITPVTDHEKPLVQIFSDEDIQNASKWLDYFRTHRYLVILDSFETILNDHPVGSYRKGFEIYGELLKQIGEERHQSCLLILSRENPKELRLGNDQRPIRTYQLTELQEAAQILLEHGLSDVGVNWRDLVKAYGGNPLALRIIAALIKESFGGSVKEFLRQKTTIFDPDLRDILNEQFDRLSVSEKEVLLKLATTPQPFSRYRLLSSISTVSSQSQLSEVLGSLQRRSLIEQQFEIGEICYTLPQVVMKFSRRMLSTNDLLP
jgi:NB-ARC domain